MPLLWFSKRFNATPNHQLNYFLNLLFEFSRFRNACDNIDVDLRGKDERKIIKIKQKCDKINLLLVFNNEEQILN